MPARVIAGSSVVYKKRQERVGVACSGLGAGIPGVGFGLAGAWSHLGGAADPVAPGGLPVELGALGAWLGCPVVAEALQLAGELVRRQAAVVLGLEVRL